MKQLTGLALCALLLSACAAVIPLPARAPADPEPARRLGDQADMAPLIGRVLTFDTGRVLVLGSDGTITGNWAGTPLTGRYEMRDGFFCRTLSAGPDGPAPEDCQLLILDGSTLQVTRNRGEGATFAYTIS